MAAMTLFHTANSCHCWWLHTASGLPNVYAASTVSSWSILYSDLLDLEMIPYRSACSSCWGDALQKHPTLPRFKSDRDEITQDCSSIHSDSTLHF